MACASTGDFIELELADRFAAQFEFLTFLLLHQQSLLPMVVLKTDPRSSHFRDSSCPDGLAQEGRASEILPEKLSKALIIGHDIHPGSSYRIESAECRYRSSQSYIKQWPCHAHLSRDPPIVLLEKNIYQAGEIFLIDQPDLDRHRTLPTVMRRYS